MQSVTQFSWYALYTAPRAEKKVQQQLQLRGYQNYLPIQTRTHLWSDRKKKVDVPVISSYVFIRCQPKDFMFVKSVPGVAAFLSLGSKPTPIDSKVIADLQFMIANAEEQIEFTGENLAVGDRVEVIKGKLKGLTGELIERQGEYKFLIRLDKFGCVMASVSISCFIQLRMENGELRVGCAI